MVAIFITIVTLIAIGYFVQLGARRGVFPVLLTLLVTVLAFFAAMNYRVDVARVYKGWAPDMSDENAVALGYLTVFGACFCLFGYFAVRFTPEIAPVYKRLDQALGTIVGILAGIAVIGSLCVVWFDSSLAARYQIPEGRIYLGPHKYLLAFYGVATGRPDRDDAEGFARFPGGQGYDAQAALKDMRGKGSKMPRSGDGFWVSSVPVGLRVFVSSVRQQPLSQFRKELEDMLGRDWASGPVRQTRAVSGYVGKAPVTVPCEDSEAWVAVEYVLDARTPIPGPDENPFADDGQVGTLTGPNRRFCKIYKLRKEQEFRNQAAMAKLIALMYDRNKSLVDVKRDLLPGMPQYTLKPDEQVHAISELKNDGLSDDEAKELVNMVLRGGKILYKARDGSNKIFEIISADGEYKLYSPMRQY